MQEVDEIINHSGSNGHITFEEFIDLMMMDEAKSESDEEDQNTKVFGIDEHIPFIVTDQVHDSSLENGFVFPAYVEDDEISHETFHRTSCKSANEKNRMIDKSYSKRALSKKSILLENQDAPSAYSSPTSNITVPSSHSTISTTPTASPTNKSKNCLFPDISPPRNIVHNSSNSTPKSSSPRSNECHVLDQVFVSQPSSPTRPRSISTGGSSPTPRSPTRENELYKASLVTRLPAIPSNNDQQGKGSNLLDALKKRLSIFSNNNNSNNRLDVLSTPHSKLPPILDVSTRARRNSSPVVPLGANEKPNGKLMPLASTRNRKASSQNGIDPKKQYSSSLNTSSYFSQRYSSTDYGTLHTREQLREAFQLFDSNNDGLVSKEEMKIVFSKIGLVTIMSDEELDQLFKIVDSDNDSNINFDEFVELFLL
ncbi:hypothetical protein C9374_008952 [Naegleria lovaniensis]|uniref:EF-hand domain-containing protein n=1 Tax=Naegleria lovaniensis TaxID=51637 RepID=A0AA88GIA2_NAELO|nr:uncharacterized protein C9374_008952 [Naegleria lovaniensis]KAG2377867.1 hypothetical protein C9374_008952 [Naegleria lovaniensis]